MEPSPLGIILCTGQKSEQIELLDWTSQASMLTTLPPRAVLVERLQLATRKAQWQIEQHSTEADADLAAVRRLFELLLNFTKKDGDRAGSAYSRLETRGRPER